MKEILIIDDEKEICRSLKGIFSDEGYEVRTALTPQEALQQVSRSSPDLVLLDVWFGKSSWDGVHLLDQLRQLYPSLPIIMISGHGTLELAVRAIKKGAYDFIEKPFAVDRLFLSVKHALETQKLRIENTGFRSKTAIPSAAWPFSLDPALKKLALMDARVLITGEPGSGKKALAFEIHKLSARREGPFLMLNGHALNTYSEEELWGREEGGVVQKPGLLEQAQGGTAVISHVHALKNSLQTALLNVLKSNTFKRKGGTTPVPLNVRLLTTSFGDAAALEREFYDRISVSTFQTFPLRHKSEYLAKWIEILFRELCLALGRPHYTLSEEAFSALKAYTWPGNIRELRNALERALLTSTTPEIPFSALPEEIRGMLSAVHQRIFTLSLQEARSLFEYRYLCAQLTAASGNISHAAQAIGMERSALHRKIKMLKEKARRLEEKIA